MHYAGNVNPGRMVISSNEVKPALAVRARDSPESCATSADEPMLDDLAAIENVLTIWNISF